MNTWQVSGEGVEPVVIVMMISEPFRARMHYAPDGLSNEPSMGEKISSREKTERSLPLGNAIKNRSSDSAIVSEAARRAP